MAHSAPTRWQNPLAPLGAALRATWRAGYTLTDLRADVLASLVVGIVALPLSMALGIASGMPPEHGLYTAIVAGAVAALCGGAPLQVTGPTAAFVVLLVPVTNRFGMGGLCLASAMAGGILLVMSLFRAGRLVRLVPHPVTLGFTGGIGVVIATLQLKDFFGLPITRMPETYVGKVATLARNFSGARLGDVAVGVFTLTALLVVPRITRKVPPALVALSLGSVLAYALGAFAELPVATIAGRFSYVVDGITHAGIPRAAPHFSLHWFRIGLEGQALGDVAWQLLPSAVAIALLAAIESLLAAVVADTMSGRRHNSDAELLGLGFANLLSPFFGGFAATGAIARTATNIRSGARSPVASLLHTGFLLAAMLALAPALGYLPMASLSALLLQVAWNMADARGIVRALKTAPREDSAVLLVSLVLTVAFDMVVSVVAGVVLSALLFNYRMAKAATVVDTDDRTAGAAGRAIPGGVMVHAIEGPLFFADAERATASLYELERDTRTVVLDLSQVSLLDASGLASLDGAVNNLARARVDVVVVPPQQPAAEAALARGTLGHGSPHVAAAKDRAAALDWARNRAY